MDISGKVFVVTGGGNGIGRDVVLALLARGARVAALDISEAGLTETLELAGAERDRASAHVVDITDRAAVEALPAIVEAEHGPVDAVINVAGIIHHFLRVNDLTYEEIDRVMRVNFYGVLHVTKTFLPGLLQRPEAHIATVSSMGAFVPVPGQTVYGASKAAVKLLMEGLHSELLETRVGVSVIFPGAIETNIAVNSGAMTEGETVEGGKEFKMTPSPVAAQQILRAIEKGSYQTYIGNDSKMMDKLSRLMPARAARIIYSQMRDLLPS